MIGIVISGDEPESDALPLGGFQFLSHDIRGPHPGAFTGFDITIDGSETFGSAFTRQTYRNLFHPSASDCADAGDLAFDLDYCWNAGAGGVVGTLGEDLDCFDYAGARWFAELGDWDDYARNTSFKIWDQADVNGDGLPDWIFASYLIARDEAGAARDTATNVNDFYVALGNGAGWDRPVPFSVPAKDGGGDPDITMLHGTGVLSVGTGLGSATPILGESSMSGLSVSTNATASPARLRALHSRGRAQAGQLAGQTAQGMFGNLGGIAYNMGSQLVSYSRGGNIADVSMCVTATNRQSDVAINVPVIGRLNADSDWSDSTLWQGLLDLDGDGRNDMVSASWNASSTSHRNSGNRLAFMHNHGAGFDAPVVVTAGADFDHPIGRDAQGLQTSVTTSVQRKAGRSHANDAQLSGFVDLNGDGLLDYVTTFGADAQTTAGDPVHWLVYHFDGHAFTEPHRFEFEGGWEFPMYCWRGSAEHSQPALFRHVSAQTNANNPLARSEGTARQVQGLYDANGDGLLDYWYEVPGDAEGRAVADGYCDYLPARDSAAWNLQEDWDELTSPYQLNTEIEVRLNTGRGFAAPVNWGDGETLALSGSVTATEPENIAVGRKIAVPTHRSVVRTGDLDANGHPDIGVVAASGVGPATLHKIGEGDADLLETVAHPHGGTTSVAYRYEVQRGGLVDRPGGMGRGLWVTDTVTTDDGIGNSTTRRYAYGGGWFDTIHRQHTGFERVFEYNDDAAGYTVSRFVQTKGFDGRLYCRAVVGAEDTRAANQVALASSSAQPPIPIAGDLGKLTSDNSPRVAVGDANVGGDLESTGITRDAPDNTLSTDRDERERERDLPQQTMPQPGSYIDVDYGAPVAGRIEPSLDTASDAATAYSGSVTDGSALRASSYTGCSGPDEGALGNTAVRCGVSAVLDAESCWVPVEGALLKEELYLWGDLNANAGRYTVRLRQSLHRLYDGAQDPLESSTTYRYDTYGNVVERTDFGDTATAEDDVTSTVTYTAPNLGLNLVAFVWEETATDRLGSTLSRVQYGYDGNPASSGAAPVRGDRTSERRYVDAGAFVEATFLHTPEGLTQRATNPLGDAVSIAYSRDFPWLPTTRTAETRTALPSGATTIVRHVTETLYHWIDTADYGSLGLVSATIDPNGARTSYTYDNHRRASATWQPLDAPGAPSVEISYVDARGRLATSQRTRRASGVFAETTTRLDGLGRTRYVEQTAPTNRAGAATIIAAEHAYDGSGRVTLVAQPRFDTDASEGTTATTYDMLGRPTVIVGPDGSATGLGYDRRTVTRTLPGGRCITVTKDGLDETTERWDELCLTRLRADLVRYTVDGRVAARTDHDGNTWEFEYDWLGRPTVTRDPNGFENHAVYDDAGNAIAQYATPYLHGTGDEKRAVGVRYDELQRPMVRTEYSSATGAELGTPAGTVERRTLMYYDLGPLAGAKISCPSSHAIGRPVRIDQYENGPGGLVQVTQRDLCYDARGQVTDEALTIGSHTYVYGYTYDNAGAMTDVTVQDVNLGDSHTMTTAFDAAGAVTRSYNDVGDIVSAATYLADGRLDERVLGGAVHEARCYSQGPAGPRLHRAVAGDPGIVVTCGEDATADVVDDLGTLRVHQNVSYGFDEAGLLTTREVGYRDPVTRLLGFFAHTYTYDGLQQLESEVWNDGGGDTTDTYGYDTVGNLTDFAGVTQTYGTESATAGVVHSGPHQINATSRGDLFTYDLAGRVETWASRNGSLYEFRRFADGKPIEVIRDGGFGARYSYDGGGNRVLSETSAGTTHFAPGGYRVDDAHGAPRGETQMALAVRVYEPRVGARNLLKLSDPLGSTSMLVDPLTGEPTQLVRYAPFGAVRELVSDGGYSTDYLYNGKRQDTGLYGTADAVYDYGFRDYNALVGRWMASDDTFADGSNLYTYVRNSPTAMSDPNGHSAVGTVVGAGAAEAALRWVASKADSSMAWYEKQYAATGSAWYGVGFSLASLAGSDDIDKTVMVLTLGRALDPGDALRLADDLTRAAEDGVQQFRQVRLHWVDAVRVGGKKVYQRSDLFDPSHVSQWTVAGKKVSGTNVERMASGRAPVGLDGKSINLHHMTQSEGSAIAEISATMHKENYKLLHSNTGGIPSGINRSQFDTWRKNYWKQRAAELQ